MEYIIKQETQGGDGQIIYNAYEKDTGKFIACSTLSVDRCETNLRRVLVNRVAEHIVRTVEI